MFLWQLFRASPVMAFALCVCLATIFWCIRFLRKPTKGPDRFLATLIGVVAICQGMRLFRQAGVLNTPGLFLVDQFADLIVTGLNLILVLILRASATERKTTAVRLRLVEANDQAPIARGVGFEAPEQSTTAMILESSPLALIAMDRSGKVTHWNPAAERLLGWKSSEVVGQMSPLAADGHHQTKSGVLLRGESWVSPLRDVSGRPCGTLLVIAPERTEQKPEPERVTGSDAKTSFKVKLAPVAGA